MMRKEPEKGRHKQGILKEGKRQKREKLKRKRERKTEGIIKGVNGKTGRKKENVERKRKEGRKHYIHRIEKYVQNSYFEV